MTEPALQPIGRSAVGERGHPETPIRRPDEDSEVKPWTRCLDTGRRFCWRRYVRNPLSKLQLHLVMYLSGPMVHQGNGDACAWSFVWSRHVRDEKGDGADEYRHNGEGEGHHGEMCFLILLHVYESLPSMQAQASAWLLLILATL